MSQYVALHESALDHPPTRTEGGPRNVQWFPRRNAGQEGSHGSPAAWSTPPRPEFWLACSGLHAVLAVVIAVLARMTGAVDLSMLSGLTAGASVGIGADGPIFGVVVPAALAVPLIAVTVTVVVLGLAAFAIGWYIVRTTGKTE